MGYTKEVPQKDGYYWCNYVDFTGNIQENIVRIENKGGQLWIFVCGGGVYGYLSVFLEANSDVRFEILNTSSTRVSFSISDIPNKSLTT